MTNEELAELERRIVAGYEGGEKTDDGSQSWGLGFEAGVRAALIATAREAEALREWVSSLNAECLRLRAENVRLRPVVETIANAPNAACAREETAWDWRDRARAALEQGEVKCTRN